MPFLLLGRDLINIDTARGWIHATLALLLIFLGSVLIEYISTLFFKRKSSFRMTNGGLIPCLIVGYTHNGILPMIGKWYPERYENTAEFRRDMAISSIAVWIFLLLIPASTLIISDIAPFMTIASNITTSFLLIYRCIPIYPFNSYGGKYIFEWNKVVFGLLVLASVIIVFVF